MSGTITVYVEDGRILVQEVPGNPPSDTGSWATEMANAFNEAIASLNITAIQEAAAQAVQAAADAQTSASNANAAAAQATATVANIPSIIPQILPSFANLPEQPVGLYLVLADETKDGAPSFYAFNNGIRFWFAMVKDN